MTRYKNLLKQYRRMAERTIKACTLRRVADYLGVRKRYKLLLPSGNNKYDSFWVRDCAMMSLSGLVPPRAVKFYLDVFLSHGFCDCTRKLDDGLTVPANAMADHINYSGRAVYFPGTYDDGENQGDGTYGYFPPYCDGYYVICLAGKYLETSGDERWLSEHVDGKTKSEILEKLFESYGVDKDTNLCRSADNAFTVDWGFCDSVQKTGLLLFSSLLRYKSAKVLEKLFFGSDGAKARHYKEQAEQIKKSVNTTFFDDGWMLSATGKCRQPDVWGTAFAIYESVLSEETEQACLKSLLKAFEDKTAVRDGYVRHLLTRDNAGRSFWETACIKTDFYQNGGWWGTPAGWYGYALSKISDEASQKLFSDYLDHYKKFRERGAPFEWIIPDRVFEAERYGTSAVLPYEALCKIVKEKKCKTF